MPASSEDRRRHPAQAPHGIAVALTIVVGTIGIPASADNTTIAFTARAAELSPLITCLTQELAGSGPVVESPQLTEGIEFRMGLQTDPATEPLVIITGLLKPNPSALEAHDDDPEAQALSAARFYRLLRVHVGTRAWQWRNKHGKTCQEAAAWIAQLRTRPILFDRVSSEGPD